MPSSRRLLREATRSPHPRATPAPRSRSGPPEGGDSRALRGRLLLQPPVFHVGTATVTMKHAAFGRCLSRDFGLGTQPGGSPTGPQNRRGCGTKQRDENRKVFITLHRSQNQSARPTPAASGDGGVASVFTQRERVSSRELQDTQHAQRALTHARATHTCAPEPGPRASAESLGREPPRRPRKGERTAECPRANVRRSAIRSRAWSSASVLLMRPSWSSARSASSIVCMCSLRVMMWSRAAKSPSRIDVGTPRARTRTSAARELPSREEGDDAVDGLSQTALGSGLVLRPGSRSACVRWRA